MRDGALRHCGARLGTPRVVAALGPGVEIEIFSDVVCPWCWIGEQRLLKALDGFDEPASLRWRAFQLDPSAESTGTPLVEWLGRRFGGPDNVVRKFAQVSGAAAGEGLTMNFDQAISANTRDAHRLIWWANERGEQRPMVEALHRAHFTDGRDIGSPTDLADVAVALGHDGAAVRSFLDSSAGQAEVDADLEWARTLGITGVPTFIFAGKYAVTGAQDPATLRQVLDEVRRREGSDLTAQVAATAESCADDSCTAPGASDPT